MSLASALSAIHCEVFPNGWDAKAMAEMLEVPGTFSVVLGAECLVLGEENLSAKHQSLSTASGMIVIRLGGEQADLITLAVREAFRRQGIAEKLLLEAMQKAASMGATQLFLEVAEDNAAAIKLYEKCGFLEISRRKAYYDGRKDALVMASALTEGVEKLS